jgi:hypothetical protein
MSLTEVHKTEDVQFKVVWIEVGRQLPAYAVRNFKLTQKLHKSIGQLLVTDSNRKIDCLQVIHEKVVPKSDKTKKFMGLKKEWPFKQEDFWLGTTKRFFHLYDLMLHFDLKNIAHLESDCILLEEKPLLDFFNFENSKSMAYPLQAKGLGCASILLLKSSAILGEFLDHILENWLEEGANDMTLLGSFLSNDHVMELATWPTQGSGGYFYDAGSIGHYFQGTDARNSRLPFSHRGLRDNREGNIYNFIDRSHNTWESSVSKSDISIKVKSQDLEGTLVNLHMHSKHIFVSSILMSRMLRKGFNGRRSFLWRLGIFDFYVFFERCTSFLNRRVLNKKDYISVNYR